MARCLESGGVEAGRRRRRRRGSAVLRSRRVKLRIPPRIGLAAGGRLPEILLAVLAAVLCLADLGGGALRDWDEATYAAVAREGVESGSWASLQLDGRLYAEKAPLVFWCMEASYRLLGVSEAAARLPSALFGIAGVVLAYRIARRLAGRPAAQLAALVLVTAPEWLSSSRQAMLDVPLATCLAAALLGALEGRWPLIGIGLGAAAMVKGPAALVALPVLGVWALTGAERRRQAAKGLLLALALAAPWHVAQIALHGDAFVAWYFGFNVVSRLSAAVEGHHGPWWFYLDYIFGWTSPWHWLGAFALAATTYRAVRARSDPGRVLVLAWFWTVLVAFTAAPTKLGWYVVPAYPALAVLTACWLAEAAPGRRWLRATVAVLAVATPLFAFGRIVAGRMRSDDADATRSVLLRLPPTSEAAVLFVADGLAVETARFYAHRELRSLARGAPLPSGAWVLAASVPRELGAATRVIASEGSRVLLGPR